MPRSIPTEQLLRYTELMRREFKNGNSREKRWRKWLAGVGRKAALPDIEDMLIL